MGHSHHCTHWAILYVVVEKRCCMRKGCLFEDLRHETPVCQPSLLPIVGCYFLLAWLYGRNTRGVSTPPLSPIAMFLVNQELKCLMGGIRPASGNLKSIATDVACLTFLKRQSILGCPEGTVGLPGPGWSKLHAPAYLLWLTAPVARIHDQFFQLPSCYLLVVCFDAVDTTELYTLTWCHPAYLCIVWKKWSVPHAFVSQNRTCSYISFLSCNLIDMILTLSV